MAAAAAVSGGSSNKRTGEEAERQQDQRSSDPHEHRQQVTVCPGRVDRTTEDAPGLVDAHWERRTLGLRNPSGCRVRAAPAAMRK